MFFNLFLLNCVMKLSNYCCVLLYILQIFADIGSYDGEEMTPLPPDPVVGLEEDAEGMMPDISEDK